MESTVENFNQFIGQKNVKRQLTLAIESALVRNVRLDHILLVATPGSGKTKLAGIIANEMYADFESFFMPINEKTLQNLMEEFEGVVLLDEIHRAAPKQQELLLTILQDGYMQTRGGYRVENDSITFIGATTEGDKVLDTIRDRFPLRPLFDPYTDEEMATIIKVMAEQEGIVIPHRAANRLAKATLGVPRNARTIVYTWRDLGLRHKQVDAQQVFRALRLTDTGLSAEHIRYCECLGKAGGKAGLGLMKQLLGMPPGAIERLETDLIKQNLLVRESTGRQLTARGFELAGVTRFGSRRRTSKNDRKPYGSHSSAHEQAQKRG